MRAGALRWAAPADRRFGGTTIVKLLLWAHLAALVVGMGGGLGMSQVRPRPAAAAPGERETWWPMARTFQMMSRIGLVVMLLTGPAMVSMKYGGMGGLNVWFTGKMALVALAVVLMAVTEIGMARLKRGDERGGRLAMTAGPLIGMTFFAVILAAVFAFN